MQIPPKYTKSKGNRSSGKTAGVSEFLRTLEIGEAKDCARDWEQALSAAAKRIGIKVVSRRLGREETLTVFRIE